MRNLLYQSFKTPQLINLAVDMGFVESFEADKRVGNDSPATLMSTF